MTMLNPDTGQPLRPTSSVAASNAGGAGLNATLTAFLLFGLGRHYGGKDMIPGDWLDVLPFIVGAAGFVCHFAVDQFQRWRFARSGGTGSGTGTGTGTGETK